MLDTLQPDCVLIKMLKELGLLWRLWPDTFVEEVKPRASGAYCAVAGYGATSVGRYLRPASLSSVKRRHYSLFLRIRPKFGC